MACCPFDGMTCGAIDFCISGDVLSVVLLFLLSCDDTDEPIKGKLRRKF